MLDLLDSATQDAPFATLFSECRTWRYRLLRRWGPGPLCVFIWLNPSTADETRNDPTVTRGINFAASWGYGGLCVLNAFAFRATDPKAMMAAADPIGPDNMRQIIEIAGRSPQDIVCGWGVHGAHMGQGEAVLAALAQDGAAPVCLGLTKHGHPKHPLYLPKTAERIPI